VDSAENETVTRLLGEFDPERVTDPLTARWGLCMLLSGHVERFRRERSWEDDLEVRFGLRVSVAELDSVALARLLEGVLERLESVLARRTRLELEDGTDLAGARRLGRLLGLGELEHQLLALLHSGRDGGPLEYAMRAVAEAPLRQQHRAFAAALGVEHSVVTELLSPRAALRKLQLVDRVATRYRAGSYEVLNPVERLLDPDLSDDDLRHLVCPEVHGGALELADYPHLAEQTEIVVTYLRRSLEDGAAGVNVLLHGPPGTGKTELVRAVARALGARLHAVASDLGDEPPGDRARTTSYAMSQRLLRSAGRTLLTFDELEDVFPWRRSGGWAEVSSATNKGWVNRQLEENPVPCLWVGNEIWQLDPAFLRRFSLIVEVPVPPLGVRSQILGRYFDQFGVSDRWVCEQARNPHVSPADAAHAAEVCRRVAPGGTGAGGSSSAEALLERVLEMSLDARGQLGGAQARLLGPFDHDLSLLNVDCDLEALVERLKQRRRGSLCLFGPPGTGKSMLVSRIADELGVECLVKTGGDLLDMYVGGTEQKIRAAFREADRSGAVLFIDEADGLLRDRSTAVRSWEATQVNELLVRMEAFRGVFFCATNLLDDLDRAALRRFGLKVRFDPLTSDQRVQMAERSLRLLGCEHAEREGRAARPALDELTTLTPGDFAAVLRGAELTNGKWTAERLVAALRTEDALKAGVARRRAVGFGR
jgi:SpoVK/Ycf46/Vps4 family AAA+-type ATPase